MSVNVALGATFAFLAGVLVPKGKYYRGTVAVLLALLSGFLIGVL